MTIRTFAAAALSCVWACAGAQALYPLPSEAPLPQHPARSLVLDTRAAANARLRNAPTYVETIVVEGRNPDARRPRALEARFAEVLMAPRSSPLAGVSLFNDVPCMSLPSTWNNIGDAHVPMSGCPR